MLTFTSPIMSCPLMYIERLRSKVTP